MGRHSRKGRAKADDPSETAVMNGDPPHQDGMAPAGRTTRPATPHEADPSRGAALRDAPAPSRGGYGAAVRSGHPEHREAGGGWGADGTGQGPAGGSAVGRVLQGRSGNGTGVVEPGGPRQEYVDAFDDDVFGAGSPNDLRPAGPPGQRGPVRPSGPHQPGNTYATHGPAERVPWQRQAQSRHGEDGADAEDPLAPPAPLPSQKRQPAQGGKGRAVTGVAAAAVTTVLAVVIAGQVADGGSHRADRAAGRADSGRSQGKAGDPASRAKDDAGGAQDGVPQAAPLSYAEKMAKPFPLDPDFKGKGRFTAVGGHQKGPGGGQLLRYRVDIEKGLPLDGDLFARAVHKTLNDKRSWAHGGERSFERVDSGHADFVITLASPRTTDVWCAKSGLDTSEDHVSCDSASTDRVMINAYRWAQGAKTFGHSRMHVYRQMLINHEVGHRIGRDHVGCPKDGAPAPVMMQQTKYLTTNGATCRPNAWPYPRG